MPFDPPDSDLPPYAIPADLDALEKRLLEAIRLGDERVAAMIPSAPSTPTAPPATPPSPSLSVVEFRDFTQDMQGQLLPNKVVAPGRTYRMTPNTSTQTAEVKALADGASNLHNLLAVGGLDEARRQTGVELAGFTVEGTPQGHSYGGLMVRYSTAALVHDLLIKGIPGTSSTPPEETFSLNCWHADGAIVENVKIDGQSIAATLFGLNSSSDITVRKCVATGTKVGFAIAIWKCANVLVQDFDGRNNRRGINIEQPAGPHTLERCDLRGTSKPHVTCNSTERSVKLKIVDPVVDAWPIRVGVSSQPYFSKPQLQKVSDVQLIVGGVDVSADKTKLLAGDVW